VTLALFYASTKPARRWILLAARYLFYMSWNWRFAPLLLSLTAIDYVAAIWMERVEGPGRRKMFLVLSLAANLGFLGFFKYYNFLAGMLAEALRKDPQAFALSIVLPLGISFHTFQSMSYVVDVYRRQQKAIRDPIDYALFIAFFPQLVAGPIVRAANSSRITTSGFLQSAKRGCAEFCGSCWDWSRRWPWPISSRKSRIRTFRIWLPIPARQRPGAAWALSPCRSSLIFPATRIWLSAWRCCWVFISP
jgi:hypothetical protein